jgi:hypothetical protein
MREQVHDWNRTAEQATFVDVLRTIAIACTTGAVLSVLAVQGLI